MPHWLTTVFGLLILIGSAVTVSWLIVRGVRRSEDPAKHIFKWLITFAIVGLFGYWILSTGELNIGDAFILPLTCVVVGIVLSLIWAPHLGAMLARPLTSMFDGGDLAPEPRALYSIAIAKRKSGKFRESIYEIQQQLTRFPTDVTGFMLLAEIHAENLNDLPAAQIIIEKLCHQPGHTPQNIANAFNQLADWHLKYSQDPVVARETLERIGALLPNTEQAQAAAQRLARLGTAEHLLSPHERAIIPLHHGVENIGLLKESPVLEKPAEEPAAEAGRLVKHLEQFPLDNKSRERLAVLYAEHYQRLDLALGEIEQLIAQPNQPAKQIARLLNLLADFQIKYADDEQAARITLQRVMDQFPNLAAADLAQQRLGRLRLETKGKEKSQEVRLGTYEQNIGLKKR